MTKLKVLMIDDEVDYCQIMKNFFTKRNYEVYLAYTLNDGLNLLNSVRPDILFLDNNLPDGQGIYLCGFNCRKKSTHEGLYGQRVL
jgi:DNA-binding response OmpR family regulator